MTETETKQPSTKLNSRWRKGAQRYSSDRTVQHTRTVRQPDGSRRRETDAPTEVRYCERAHEATGWRKGARITLKTGD